MHLDYRELEKMKKRVNPKVNGLGQPKQYNNTKLGYVDILEVGLLLAGILSSLEIDMSGIDDDELDSYIMSEKESKYKGSLWNKVNAEYLEQQKDKEEKRLREKEEGKPEKKRRRTAPKRNKNQGPANSAGEAIEKMLQEKRISSKINYEVLKSLSVATVPSVPGQRDELPESPGNLPGLPRSSESYKISSPSRVSKKSFLKTEDSPGKQTRKIQPPKVNAKRAKKDFENGSIPTDQIKNLSETEDEGLVKIRVPLSPEIQDAVTENEDYVDEEAEAEAEGHGDGDAEADELSVGQMLGRYAGDDEYGYGYEDEDY